MNSKLVTARAVEVIAISLTVFVALTRSNPVDGKAAYDRIQIGMTEEEADAIVVGCLTLAEMEMMYQGVVCLETVKEGDWHSGRICKNWFFNAGHIMVRINDNSRIVAKEFTPVRPKKIWERITALFGL